MQTTTPLLLQGLDLRYYQKNNFLSTNTVFTLKVHNLLSLLSLFTVIDVGHFGRPAVLIAVTVDFGQLNSVGVGDILLSINGVATSLLSAGDLDVVLRANVASFEVVAKVVVARRQAYQTIPQTWDYDHPCAFCGYVYLKSDSSRTQCCMNGRALDAKSFPILFPLPPLLDHLARNRINHMSSNSTYYNNMLALGAVRSFICA